MKECIKINGEVYLCDLDEVEDKAKFKHENKNERYIMHINDISKKGWEEIRGELSSAWNKNHHIHTDSSVRMENEKGEII